MTRNIGLPVKESKKKPDKNENNLLVGTKDTNNAKNERETEVVIIE